ncbi:MAG: acetate kinase [Colwellia sp.]|nr:acetate kinase [Colwellia sp.]
MQNNSIKQNVLVINCGSSSVKFSLINPTTGNTMLNAIAERLNSPQAILKITLLNSGSVENKQFTEQFIESPNSHKKAIELLVEFLKQKHLISQIQAIGHRVVHGGEIYCQPTLITNNVVDNIDKLSQLAPLHNPANVIGIKAARLAFKSLPQFAVFDTAFHQSMPEKAYLYGIPYKLYQENGIRRYGFHGTSHYYVANTTAELINKPLNECNFISAHLGNGCSVTAIKNGKSVDTSMGFTPLEGVMMGTRSGDIDPGIIFYLVEQLNYTIEQVNKLLNKKSGLLGLSGISNDCRTLEYAMLEKGDKQAELALNIFCYRIAKAIASFSASLQSIDGLIFTGGIGENSSYVRSNILAHLTLLNFSIDQEKNLQIKGGKSGSISKSNSCSCWVIPTNEEWVIAKQSHQLLIEQNITAINQIQ